MNKWQIQCIDRAIRVAEEAEVPVLSMVEQAHALRARVPEEKEALRPLRQLQNGLVQARQFTEAVELTGVVLTKLDGSAKGGIVFAIQSELGIPVKLVGSGERLEDLQPFDGRAFARAIFSPEG